jgi:hypothetical protein
MVYILGCDHYVQHYDLTELDEEIRQIEHEVKNKFYELIKEIIQSQKIQFIGEECSPGQKTIPGTLAAELGCAYCEIDMAVAEREVVGIERNYQSLGDKERNRGYSLREDHMVRKTYLESTVDARKLIVCGAEHLKALKKKFWQYEETVEIRDILTENLSGPVYKRKNEKFLF